MLETRAAGEAARLLLLPGGAGQASGTSVGVATETGQTSASRGGTVSATDVV